VGSRATSNRATLIPFAPLAEGTRSDAVARRLSDAIKLGLIGDGDPLPAEAELAAQLGVATVTLREALKALRRDGLIETRRGRAGGSFVRSPPATSLQRVRARLRELSADELRDLGDYRAAVSGASAGLAAERGSPFEVSQLADQAGDVADVPGIAGSRRADSRFHIRLAAIGHSIRLTRAEIAIQAEIGELLLLLHDDGAERGRAATEHEAIMAAVSARDGERARPLAEAHVAADSARLIELHIELAGGGPR
jgi:GntR family transcriptional regulator, transcriptional repressor for pyruvate dehydrogenase complex